MPAVVFREIIQRGFDFPMIQPIEFPIRFTPVHHPSFMIALGGAKITTVGSRTSIRVPITGLVLIEPFACFLFQDQISTMVWMPRTGHRRTPRPLPL